MNTSFEPFQKVLVRDADGFCWRAAFYSHKEDVYIAGASRWAQCIPYVGNEHFLGTRESPEPAYEFKQGDIVAVRNKTDEGWRVRVFNHKESESVLKYLTFDQLGINECWRYCKLAKEVFANFG